MPPGMLPPGVPPPPPPSGRCDRACTARNLYECRTEAACTGVGKQWKPPARPIGAGLSSRRGWVVAWSPSSRLPGGCLGPVRP